MIATTNTERALKLLFALLLGLSVSDGFAQDNNEATPITVTEVVSTSVAPTVPAAGTVFSRNETQITAGMAGRLEYLAEPGDFVEAGTSVAVFDCEMLELQRERQLAEADRATINFKTLAREVGRLESVRDSHVIAEIQLDRTAADRDLARSDLQIAQIAIRETDSQLARCNVRAPFSGVVTQRMRNPGEDVERSTILAAMTDTENLEVRASVPIRYLPRMRAGVAAEVRLNELRLEARIRKVVPAANSQSQTFEVRLEDLLRGTTGYVLARWGLRLLSDSEVAHVDGPRSVRAAFSLPEVRAIAAEAGLLRVVVRRSWPERFVLRWRGP